MDRKAVARELVSVARELVGFDVTKEFEATVKTMGSLARQFKDAHADLIREANEAEKAWKDKQEALKAFYKDWATQSGFKPLRAALLQQAQTCMAIGDTLGDLSEELQLVRRESEQESYKEKYNVLVSMLNEAELKKYGRLLDTFFSKQVTEVKTGLKLMDDDLKDWHAEAKAIAEERKIKLPKASDRAANVLEDVAEAIRSKAAELVGMVRDFFAGMLDRVTRNGRALETMDKELAELAARARTVM